MQTKVLILLFSCLILISPLSRATPLSVGEAPDTGLRYWFLEEAGISFKLTQRLPDQTRAFFRARGFNHDATERIALACVFQSEFQNTADRDQPPISYDLTEWRVLVDGKTQPLLVREFWSDVWENKYSLPKSARIAFEWALLPTRQTYESKDFNWGMTVYGLSPGSKFDLEFSWYRGEKHFSRRINNIECPPDIHPQPE
ncbi:MAG: hypothetical protein PVG13_02785 [Thiohalophilus sp.]|jgi:hypothetical protein